MGSAWTWTLNWGEIRSDLVVGSCPMTARDLDTIRAGTATTALLSLQTDECRAAFRIDYRAQVRHARKRGVKLVNVPMRDFDPPDQRRHLPDAVRALHRLLADGDRVYVHCTAGINRSPLAVLAYLSFVEGSPAEESLRFIRRGRPEAEPYQEAFDGCWRDLCAGNRDAVALAAWTLAQQRPDAAAAANWYAAERQVIRALFLAEETRRQRRDVVRRH